MMELVCPYATCVYEGETDTEIDRGRKRETRERDTHIHTQTLPHPLPPHLPLGLSTCSPPSLIPRRSLLCTMGTADLRLRGISRPTSTTTSSPTSTSTPTQGRRSTRRSSPRTRPSWSGPSVRCVACMTSASERACACVCLRSKGRGWAHTHTTNGFVRKQLHTHTLACTSLLRDTLHYVGCAGWRHGCCCFHPRDQAVRRLGRRFSG